MMDCLKNRGIERICDDIAKNELLEETKQA